MRPTELRHGRMRPDPDPRRRNTRHLARDHAQPADQHRQQRVRRSFKRNKVQQNARLRKIAITPVHRWMLEVINYHNLLDQNDEWTVQRARYMTGNDRPRWASFRTSRNCRWPCASNWRGSENPTRRGLERNSRRTGWRSELSGRRKGLPRRQGCKSG